MFEDDFIARWHERVAGALDEALEFLAGHEECPFSDGVLGEWVRELCAFRFQDRHVPPIVALMGKRDPLLQEAGVLLAKAALQHVDCSDQIEPSLAALARLPPDNWVLQAIVDLLSEHVGILCASFISVYRELVQPPKAAPGGFGIMRNRHIDPRRDLIELYEQQVLQTLQPSERDLLFLPILEARYGTRGFQATQRAILERMGLDVAHHLRVLSGR